LLQPHNAPFRALHLFDLDLNFSSAASGVTHGQEAVGGKTQHSALNLAGRFAAFDDKVQCGRFEVFETGQSNRGARIALSSCCRRRIPNRPPTGFFLVEGLDKGGENRQRG
jgi:hypothetical protein